MDEVFFCATVLGLHATAIVAAVLFARRGLDKSRA